MGRKARPTGAMHVVTNKVSRGGREYTSVLLRRSYREDGKVKKQTLANLSHLPPDLVELIRASLRGESVGVVGDSFQIESSLPAGHVQAALTMAKHLELARLLDRSPSKERDLAMAMICQRVIAPASKLATTRQLSQSTLALELGVKGANEDDLYSAMDWLLERQDKIESRLARRHLKEGQLVLYDLSSSYFEGRNCVLAKRGYSRDGKTGTPQIVYGLLCDRHGRPVAVEVFEGNLLDHQTVPNQVKKLKARFGLKTVVVVSDRGMVTKANIELFRQTEGVKWVTALKAPQVKKLVKEGSLQLSLFDEANLAEITSQDYPGERLVVCRNPLVGTERTRKRDELLEATEQALQEIAERVKRGTLTGGPQIGLAVGLVIKRYRMKKHFNLEISDTSFKFSRKTDQIKQEAALDGIYILRTSVSANELPTTEVVRSYKQLAQVERAFKTFKGQELLIRPIHHHLEPRVRAHVFLCMLAYYLTWHLREAWAELLFKDECPPLAKDPVVKAARSTQKARSKRGDGQLAHSYRSLLAELATLTSNEIKLPGSEVIFTKLSEPNLTQARALELVQQAPVTA